MVEFLLPDWLWVDGELKSGVGVGIGEDGRIVSVGSEPGDGEIRRLPGRVLLPGFVNAHSHAFQRVIRGRTEFRQPGRESDDFWSWREQMYAAALALTPEDVEISARMAFLEMALAGITTVGEFHYLHHPAEGGRYEDPDELAKRVAAAAEAVGIHLVLLRVSYARAGHRKEANPRQIRFIDESAEEGIEAVSRLRNQGMEVGLAPHSVRAVPLDWIRSLASFAESANMPLHMHVSEQPREIEECLAEHGRRPIALLHQEGVLGERFTGVHGIHLEESEVAALGTSGAHICACPTTERNLGDGIVPARELRRAGVQLSLGTDSQAEISPLAEMRALEGNLRLRDLQRVALAEAGEAGGPDALGANLLRMATEGGASSLRQETGKIRAGAWADLVAFDLDDPSICGATPETLLTTIALSAERPAIREVWARGRQIVEEGRHPIQGETGEAFRGLMRRLWSA